MGYYARKLTEKAEEVENYLEDLGDSEREFDRFYRLCDFIMDNNLLDDGPQTIKELFEKSSV